MQKRVIIVHGWDGNPQEGWFPWLKKELQNKRFNVNVPAMPNPEEPEIKSWVAHLSNIVGEVDQNTFFVGHSIGCQTILRYLETLPNNKKVGGAVFVAGWFTLKNLQTDEEKEIAKPWLETPIDLQKVKQHTKTFIAIFSDNDSVVPFDNKKMFEKNLGAKTFVEHKKGHLSPNDGIRDLPTVLESVIDISHSHLRHPGNVRLPCLP